MKLQLLVLAILLSSFAFGQDDLPAKSEACDTSLTFWTVDVLPQYKGGNEQLLRDLNSKIKFGATANGICRIDFMINCNGKAWGFKIDSGIEPELRIKILNELSILQNWEPGKYNNKNVDSSYTLILAVEDGKIKEGKKTPDSSD